MNRLNPTDARLCLILVLIACACALGSPAAAHDGGSVGHHSATAEDIAQIISLQSRWMEAVDNGDMATYRDSMVPAMHLVVHRGGNTATLDGRDKMVKMTSDLLTKAGAVHLLHHIGSITIDPIRHGKTRVTFSALYVLNQDSRFSIVGTGFYVNDVVWQDGAWRLSGCDLVQVASPDMPGFAQK